ncbi:MAG: ABC-F family ATP-binding cassette domain-containing protein [Clostridia bacterium]|nr:ABC-F family ATP-binding cassette domain-containing protein [Loktanella sp.]MBQ1950422.1 ABC-F family ATP-binding cassette domain-containing protein [Clostridia bacterium]
MARLSIQKLNKYFGERALFADLSFEVAPGDKIGLVGDNGCGKSTLLRIIAGEELADGGSVVRYRDTAIGYMEQHVSRDVTRTLWQEVESVFSPVMAVEKQLADVNARLEQQPATSDLLDRQQALREQLESMGGLYYKSRVRATLLGLGFSESDFDKSVALLSGGERSKAAMGRLLLAQTNVLLLDEPTNHLDIPSVEWLEGYLQEYTGALLVVSHDRYFLDRVTNRTIELKNGRLYMTAGNYTAHKQQREKDKEIEQKHYKTAMQEIRHIEENIALLKQWNREKSIRAAESREKRVARLREELVAPEQENATLRFRFAATHTGGNEVLKAGNLSKSFGDNTLFREAELELRRGERVFLLGANGCGKTTLLRVLCGRLQPDSGYVRLGAKVSVGYYDQVQEGLDSRKTALQELWDTYPDKTETELRSALAAFLFRGDDVFKTVGVMSGGERARLLLLKLMLAGDNLLLLDEPTNHLDIASREALEEALEGYDGTILAVSHDRYFIQRMASRTLRLNSDGLRMAGQGADAFVATTEPAVASPAPEKPPQANAYKQRKERAGAMRRLQTTVRRAEERIAALEQEVQTLNEQLADPAVGADYARLTELTAALENANRAMEEQLFVWEESQQELENLQQEENLVDKP